jgi:hypothetical protein
MYSIVPICLCISNPFPFPWFQFFVRPCYATFCVIHSFNFPKLPNSFLFVSLPPSLNNNKKNTVIFCFIVFCFVFCFFQLRPLRKALMPRPHAVNAAHLQRVSLVLVAPAEAAVERAGLPGGGVLDGGLAGGGGVLGVRLGLLGWK